MRTNYSSPDVPVLFVTISSLSVLLISGTICHQRQTLQLLRRLDNLLQMLICLTILRQLVDFISLFTGGCQCPLDLSFQLTTCVFMSCMYVYVCSNYCYTCKLVKTGYRSLNTCETCCVSAQQYVCRRYCSAVVVSFFVFNA